MSFFKLVTRLILLSSFLLGLCEFGYSQACNGFNPGPVGGGLSLSDNGQICSNLPGAPAIMEIKANNVNDVFGAVQFEINKNDGSPTYRVAAIPDTDPFTGGPHAYKNFEPLTFLPGKCEYFPTVRLIVGTSSCGLLGVPPRFVRWNTDDFPSGQLELSETIYGANEYLICAGTPTTVTFTDRSTLNCVPPILTQDVNQFRRWRQYIYGTSSSNITGSVLINGVPQAFPFSDIVNQSTNPPSPPTPIENPGQIPGIETFYITIPASAVVGEVFVIQMNYWNTCNPYDDPLLPGPPSNLITGDHAAVVETAIIRIIDTPAQPIIDDLEICFDELGTTTLSVNNIQGGATYQWYSQMPTGPANLIHIGATFSPNNAQAPIGANHYFVTATAGTSCVSLEEEVILTRRADISAAPTGIIGDPDVCPNGTEVYSFATDPATEVNGGATEYIWTIPPGWTLNSGQGTKSISVLTSGTLGGTSLSVARRYVTTTTSGSQCESSLYQFPITVRANPTASPLTPFGVCEGDTQGINGNPSTPFGTITIHSWTGNTSILDATNVQVPNTVVTALHGNYNLTYAFTNSIGCSGSVPVVVNISEQPTAASVPTQQLLCQVSLQSNPLGGNTPILGTGTWTIVSKPTGSSSTNANFSNQLDPNATFTGDVYGPYILRWTIVNGSCSKFAEELVDFGTDPGLQNAGPDDAFCGTTGSLNAVAPTIGKGTWTQVGGPIANNTLFTDATSRTSGISLINTTTPAIGNYTYRWSVISGRCLPARTDDVIITFNSPVTANDLIETVCETTIATGIAVNVDLRVYHDGITGIVGSVDRSVEWFTDVSRAPATKITTPESFNVTNGTLYTRVTNTLIPPFCTEDAEVSFTVNPLPSFAGVIGVSQSVCEGSDPSSFIELAPTFGGIGPYTYQWQESTDNVTFTDVLGGVGVVFDPPVVPVTTYYKRLVSASACSPLESNSVRITLNPLPTGIVSAPKPKICEDDFFILDFDFTGTAPFYFDYNDGTTFVNNRIGANNTPIPIFEFNNNTTYTLTRLVDFNGCVANFPPNPSTTVDVVKINTDFMFSPSSQCSGVPFSFEWIVDDDVEYTWIWNDGTADRVIAPGYFPAGLQSVPHPFTSANATGNTNIPVTLSATNSVEGCGPKISTKTITVFPSILINVFPDKNVICSGETVKFTNSTKGGTNHRWYYRQKGTTTPIFDERNLATATTQDFVFTNTTSTDPIPYEVVYEVSTANCSDFATFDVSVYREVVASFNEGTVPPLIGGNSTVNFTNTSTPVDGSDFEYHWEFGIGATPLILNTAVVTNAVQYSSVGLKTVTLTAVNIDARTAGVAMGCPSTFTKTIDILLLPLRADFKYTPQTVCFPSDIRITENLATGDVYEWKLFSTTSGDPLIISNEALPTFKVANPGSYFIELKTTSSISNNPPVFKDNSATPIEIFDLPFADFEMRPPSVYVPDEKVFFTNRSTDASLDLFSWDFGDGGTSKDLEPEHMYAVEGKYTITLIAGSNHGAQDFDGDGITDGDLVCYDTARQELTAKEGGLSRIPNAFTPDTSGPNGGISGGGTFNDVFMPITKGVEEFEMDIFDRWGNLLFQSKSKDIGWDGYDKNGVLLPAGVYVYKLTMRLSNNQRTTQVGDVTLIR